MSLQSIVNKNASILKDMYAQFDVTEDQTIQNAFAEISAHVQRVGAILPVAIKGYTPSFNDGDACVHSSEAFVGELIVSEAYDIVEEVDVEEVAFESEDAYSEIELNAIVGFFNGINEYIAKQSRYGTNFIILYVFNADGTVDRHEIEYDCGW